MSLGVWLLIGPDAKQPTWNPNLRHGEGLALEIVSVHLGIESFYLSTLVFPSPDERRKTLKAPAALVCA